MPKLNPIDSELLEETRRYFVTQIVDNGQRIESYVDIPHIVNPFQIDKSHLMPNTEMMSLPRFFELTNQLITFVKGKEGKPVIPMVQEYPPIDMSSIGTEVITFRVVKRCPASMSPDSTGGKHVRPIAYHQFTREDCIVVSRRPLDHELELSCWATTNKAANETALWLEDLMVSYGWAFRQKGVEVLEFKERLSDGYMVVGDSNKIYYRPLRFFVRLNEFKVQAIPAIKEIELELNIKRG